MILMIFLALTNGLIIGLVRAVNGRLTLTRGPFKASFWTHLVGFVFMSALVMNYSVMDISFGSIPWVAYLGGVAGAFYVTVNAYIVPKLGTTLATILVISGQLVASTLIDSYRGLIQLSLSLETLQLTAGILLIAAGIYVSFFGKKA